MDMVDTPNALNYDRTLVTKRSCNVTSVAGSCAATTTTTTTTTHYWRYSRTSSSSESSYLRCDLDHGQCAPWCRHNETKGYDCEANIGCCEDFDHCEPEQTGYRMGP